MATVGIFDSGVGGLSVLKELRKLLPGERYLYFSDNAFCPYGGKSPEEIIRRAKYITEFLISRGAEVIVVACNTATAAAISYLRENYPIPFIGMEPAVKPAALGTRTGTIGVLATAGTLAASKYLNTKGRFEDDVRIEEHVGEGFVELVEKGDLDSDNTREVVGRSLRPLLESGADKIVLGCTHYPFLMKVIQEIAGEDVEIIDPAPSIARRLSDVISETFPGRNASIGEGSVELFSSGSPENLERTFKLIA